MKRSVVVLCLAVVAIVAVACGAATASTPAGPTATAAPGPLVTVTTRGGECQTGPCGQTVTVDRDGRVHVAAKPPNDLGTVPSDLVRTLSGLVATTDYGAMRSHPFTGQCPTAYDGQEYVFEFAAPGGAERIASCEVPIDWGSPLFVAVSTAFVPFVPLPTT